MARVSFDWISLGINEELFKVPRDVRPRHRSPNDALRIAYQGDGVVTGRRKFLSEPLEDWMRVRAVDHDFLHEHGFGDESVSGSDVMNVESNLLAVAVLLMAELVARESQDDEAIAEALQQLVHLQVIPCGCASQRGDVFDEDDFALER